ncbi:MAG: hypothetical protein ACYCYF_13660 [Anaerolineae bacterium]
MDDRSRPYVDAEQRFAALERQRLAGEISEQGYKDTLNALRVKDDAGHTWMLQERTGKWYVYREGAWSQEAPSGREMADPVGTPPPPAPAEEARPATVRNDSAAPVPPVFAPPPVAATPIYPAAPPAYQPTPPAYQAQPAIQAVPPVHAAPVAFPPPPPAATPAPPPAAYASPVSPQEAPRAGRAGRSRRYQANGYRPGCLKITLTIVKWEILWGAAGWVAYSAAGQRHPWVLIPVALIAVAFMALYLRRFGRTVSEGARA